MCIDGVQGDAGVTHQALGGRCAVLVEEVPRQEDGVAVALAERRKAQGDLGQPIEKVLAEPAGADQIVQIAMSGAHHPHIDGDLLAAADALDHTLLQEAQQLTLERRRQISDLVQEQGAAVGELDPPERLLFRAREGPALVTEQLGLQQGLGDRRAVDRDEATLAARAGGVDGPRHDLLAGAAFAVEDDARVGRRHPLDLPAQLDHRRACADDARQHTPARRASQLPVLPLQGGGPPGKLDREPQAV